MKKLFASFLVVLLSATLSFAQQPVKIRPELDVRNGINGLEAKIPEAKNLTGVWERVGGVQASSSDVRVFEDPMFASTIVIMAEPKDPDEINLALIRGDEQAIILDIEFENKSEHDYGLPYDCYSIDGSAKTRAEGKYDRVDFYEDNYDRLTGFMFPAIKKWTSIGDQYLVLETGPDYGTDVGHILGVYYEVFAKKAPGVAPAVLDVEYYKPRPEYPYYIGR